VFEIDREIVYTVQSQTVKNKIYEVAVEGNKIKHCTCQGWATHKKCKHAQQIKKNKLTVNLTPQEKAIERQKASKIGKAIAPKVSQHPAYKTTKEKIDNDSDLKSFMDTVNG